MTHLAGQCVTLHSLVGRPELNGQRGIAGPFDQASQRFPIKVEGESKMIAIKPDNLAASLFEDGGRKAFLARLSKSIGDSRLQVQEVTHAFADHAMGERLWLDPPPGVLLVLHNVSPFSSWFFAKASIAGLSLAQHRHGSRLLAFMDDPLCPGDNACVVCVGIADGGQRPDTAADFLCRWAVGNLAGERVGDGIPLCDLCQAYLVNDWAESVSCNVCDAVVCISCFSKLFTHGRAPCAFCTTGSFAHTELSVLEGTAADARCAILLARFLQFNHFDSYVVDGPALKELADIRSSTDFMRSDLTMSKDGLKGCLRRCRDAAKEVCTPDRHPDELLPLVAMHSRIWKTQGLRRPLLRCTALGQQPCSGQIVDALIDGFETWHIAFVVCASGHVCFMPQLQQLDPQEMLEWFKPQYKVPQSENLAPCAQNVPAFLDGLRAEIEAVHKRLSIAERVYGSKPATRSEEPLPGRCLLMRLLADLHVSRESKLDEVYLQRKIARQKEIAREFDSPEVRQYLLTGYEHMQLDAEDLSEELDWLLARAVGVASEFHDNGAFWQMVRTARQEINHKAMGAIQRCRVCWTRTGKKCSGCDIAYYCSSECSGKDWQLHKSECKQNRKKTKNTRK